MNGVAGLRRHLGLAWTPPWALARYDRASQQQLAAPDAPWLTALERTAQAGQPGLAAPAHGLGGLHILRRFREEQLRVFRARKIQADRERASRLGQHELADRRLNLVDYLPDVWLLPRRDGSGRLKPRCARLPDGGIAPMHRCHPLSLAGPSCRRAISRRPRD